MVTSVPTSWAESTLRDVCEPTKLWNPLREPREEFWYIDVSAVSRESYAIREPQRIKGIEAPSRARKIVQTGDTIFATVRPTLRRVAFVGNEFNDQIASTAFCIVRANREKASPRFLYYLLLTDFLNEEISRFESGASYPAVNDKDVLDRTIPFPPKPEQERIAATLFKVQRAVEVEEKLIATARDLKKSAMRQLFTRGLRGEPQKETDIGPVPDSWHVDQIGDRCQRPEYGFTASATAEPRGPKFLRITDLTGNGVSWTAVPFCECPPEVETAKQLHHNDIVIARIGATTGKSFIVKNPPTSVFASYLIRLRVQPGLDPDYLHYFLGTDAYWAQINANKGSNLKGGVNGSLLASLHLPVPSLDEQQEIAAILQTIDRKISVHERKRATLQELFKTLLHRLMTGEVRVDDLDIDTSEVA